MKKHKGRPATVVYAEYNSDNPTYFTVHYRHLFVRDLCYTAVAQTLKIDPATIFFVFYGHCHPIKTA